MVSMWLHFSSNRLKHTVFFFSSGIVKIAGKSFWSEPEYFLCSERAPNLVSTGFRFASFVGTYRKFSRARSLNGIFGFGQLQEKGLTGWRIKRATPKLHPNVPQDFRCGKRGALARSGVTITDRLGAYFPQKMRDCLAMTIYCRLDGMTCWHGKDLQSSVGLAVFGGNSSRQAELGNTGWCIKGVTE